MAGKKWREESRTHSDHQPFLRTELDRAKRLEDGVLLDDQDPAKFPSIVDESHVLDGFGGRDESRLWEENGNDATTSQAGVFEKHEGE